MPTNANTFNSRVTSEALEAKFRQVFPAQGGAELVQDLFASGVIQPVVDFSTVAEGSVLQPNLQIAWDFSTGHTKTASATNTLINNAGFWLVDVQFYATWPTAAAVSASLSITDGLTSKKIYGWDSISGATATSTVTDAQTLTVFLRSGDSLTATTNSSNLILNTSYRQIADVNGNLVNPLGFTFS